MVAAAHLENDGPTSIKIEAIVKPRQRKNKIVNTTRMRPRLISRLLVSSLTGISQVKHFVSPLQRRPPQFRHAVMIRVYPTRKPLTIRRLPHFCFRLVSNRAYMRLYSSAQLDGCTNP